MTSDLRTQGEEHSLPWRVSESEIQASESIKMAAEQRGIRSLAQQCSTYSLEKVGMPSCA